MRGRLLVLTALCLLAFPVGMAQAAVEQSAASRSQPQRYLTVNVALGPTVSATQGQALVALAQQDGFNSLRIIMPWTGPWQHEAVNDASRICGVAIPAAAAGMGLFLDLEPTNATPPTISRQITWYDKTLGDYLQWLVGDNGCAKGLKEIDVQVANEPNNPVFYGNQATAPADYTHLLVRTCLFISQQIAKHGFSAPIHCVGGELASSHDPVGFINKMKAEAGSMGVSGQFFDMFSYHCYGTNGAAYTPPDAIRSALKSDFGYAGSLLCTEYAVPNATVQQYCHVLAMAQNSGLDGFGWFRLLDDSPSSPQPTGLNYYDPVLGNPGDHPVAKIPGLTAMNTAASSGSLSCGPGPSGA